jgi:hypothetical protein
MASENDGCFWGEIQFCEEGLKGKGTTEAQRHRENAPGSSSEIEDDEKKWPAIGGPKNVGQVATILLKGWLSRCLCASVV